MSLDIPGWTCACGIFNGAAKEWLTHCRVCDTPSPRREFTFALDYAEAQELISLIDGYALEYESRTHRSLRARLVTALRDEVTRAQLAREAKE